MKRELLAMDLEEDEIYEKMSQEKPIFIFITDLTYYFKQVYEGEFEMSGFLENISEKNNVSFYISINGDENAIPDFIQKYV